MSKKRDKKGFLRLNHDKRAVVGQNDDSESEIELMDMTGLSDVKTPVSNIGEYVRDKAGRCEGWCVSLSLLLLTFGVISLSLFLMFVAYNMQLIKGQIDGLNQQIQSLEDEISSIKTQFNEVTKDHASHISAINSTLGNVTSHTNSIYASLHVDISELGVTLGRVTGEVDILQQQIANAGFHSFNKSMAIIASFSDEVQEIHTGLAQINSKVESLNDQVVETKKSCGDVVGDVNDIRAIVSKVDDSMTVLQKQSDGQKSKVDARLNQLSNTIEGHTKVLQSIHWVTNYTSLVDLANHVAKVTKSSLDDIIQSKVAIMLDQLHELQDTVANITDLLSAIDIPLLPPHVNNTPDTTPTPTETTPINNNDAETTPIFNSTTTIPVSIAETTPTATPSNYSVNPTEDSTLATEDRPDDHPNSNQTTNSEPTDVEPTDKPIDTNSTDIDTEPTDTNANDTETTIDDIDGGSGYLNQSDVDHESVNFIRPEMTPAEALQSVVDNFSLLDGNQDNQLSVEEFSVVFDDGRIFDQLDIDEDRYITVSELQQSIERLSKLEGNN